MASIRELQEKANQLRADCLAIHKRAADEGREISAEESQGWDAANDAFDAVRKELEQAHAAKANADNRSDRLKAMDDFLNASPGKTTDAAKPLKKTGDDGDETKVKRDPVKMAAFRRFLTAGHTNLQPAERAALQMDVDASGGTLVIPEEFLASLIQFVDDRLYLRSLCTVLPLISAESVGVPSLETDPADADWTSELATGSEDSTMTTGKRALHPKPLGKLIKVSKTLLRRSAIPVESLVRQRLGYKFAVTEEKGFLTGNGANQPLGLFTASANGISTARDVSTDMTTTAITADGLINVKFSLKAQYMASANTRWLFHRTAVRNIRKLKDGNGQYLWQAGLAGTPDSILEVPYLMSEYVPVTFTTGLYVGLIGDLTWYYIAESLRMELQRLDELYAATNQVGFIGRMELDGMPVLEEAFARVKLA